ncbi:MAG: hypothetical protein ACRCVJ_13225 [Clostridium sp.]|uniref:hypothetical protein n=1 Tax=Clostridium sp. TaxID=1506 RepID=UPI003F39B019
MENKTDNIKKAKEIINNQNFWNICLNEISELKFDKTHNILIVLIGVSSPIIPLIYLYKKYLFEKMELTEILVIGVCINLILLFMIKYINNLKNLLKIYCQYLKLDLEMSSIKASKVLLKKSFKSVANNMKNKNIDKPTKIKLKLTKLSLDRAEKGYSNLNVIVAYLKDKKTYEVFENDFINAIITNIIVGAVVILIKLATFVNIIDINFKGVCWILILLYSINIFVCILRIFKIISIISFTQIYKIIGRGYVQEVEEQITFFDEI